MRQLLLAAAACAAAAPALAKAPVAISPDPMTVSGRFALPPAPAPAAGRVRLGAVKLDADLAAKTRQDGPALETAVRGAVSRSLQNFGYLVDNGGTGGTAVDVELLPLSVTTAEGATDVVAQLRFTASGRQAGCFGRVAEGRFKVLERERSGGGRRAFAVGVVVALAAVGVNGGTLLGNEFNEASMDNKARNAFKKVSAGEGVSPGFGPAKALAYGASSATQLALADYIRQLGEAPECAAGPENRKVDAGVSLAPVP